MYLQQYTEWATNQPHPTLPATAVGAAIEHPAPPPAKGSTVTLEASQFPLDQATTTAAAAGAAAGAARVPFAAISKLQPFGAASGKAASKAGLPPPSQIAAFLDQENAATHAPAAGKHVYSMRRFGVDGATQHSAPVYREGRQGKVVVVGSSMSLMHMC